MQPVRIDTRARVDGAMRMLGLIGVISGMTACGLGPRLPGDGESTDEADTSATSMALEPTDTASTPDTDTEGPLDTDTEDPLDTGTEGTEGTEGTDDGPDVPECEPGDETVVAQFSVAVDGTPIVIDYSEFDAPETGIPEGWSATSGQPEIDGPCQVIAFEADQGSVSLLCEDTLGISRTVDLAFSSSPALAPALAVDEIHFYYAVQHAQDERGQAPDTTAHGFALWTDAGLVLAGLDGRFSVGSWLAAAWPVDPVYCEVTRGDCLPRARVRVRLGLDHENTTLDGSFVPVGDRLVVVERALIEETDPKITGGIDMKAIRLLMGPPA